jgi:hypothetical protein
MIQAATNPGDFQDRCLKPLGHPSVLDAQRLSRGVGPGKGAIAGECHFRALDFSLALKLDIAALRSSMVGLAESDSQQTGAQQHEAGRGQREESVGYKVMISHDTPAVSMLVRIH